MHTLSTAPFPLAHVCLICIVCSVRHTHPSSRFVLCIRAWLVPVANDSTAVTLWRRCSYQLITAVLNVRAHTVASLLISIN